MLQDLDIQAFGHWEKETLQTGKPAALYAKARLHAATLLEDDRKILVDMPGLDSGLRTHNAAIQRYLPLGSYFVLVVDVEHGGLRESEVRQLREFLDREIEFAVLVNKIDKKQRADTEAVVSHIREQVKGSFGTPAPVQPVSAHEDDVSAFREILKAIDFDRALRGFWRGRVVGLFDEAIQSLHTRSSALNVTATESERVIAELEEKKRALEAKLKEDAREIRGRYSDRAVDRIVRNVRSAVRDHAAALARTYQAAGKQAFEYECNEVVRRTLNSVLDHERSETLREIVERYQADIEEIDKVHVNGLDRNRADAASRSKEIAGFAHLLMDTGRKGASAFGAATKNFSNEKMRTSYLAISGVLAATTSFVAPLLEVVMILLPTILGRFSEKREEERQLQNLESHIASVAASKIASALRGRIAEGYEKITRDMLAQLRNQVQNAVGKIQTDINKSRAELEERDGERRQAQLHAAIDRLREARKPLEDDSHA